MVGLHNDIDRLDVSAIALLPSSSTDNHHTIIGNLRGCGHRHLRGKNVRPARRRILRVDTGLTGASRNGYGVRHVPGNSVPGPQSKKERC